MININSVYQKVLVIANKEQRGYLTPQEFNLLADKAQLDILDGYFHDVKTAYHKPKNQTGFSDEMEMLSEKLQPFRSTENINYNSNDGYLTLPTNLYRLITVSREEREITELSKREVLLTESNPLTKATIKRSVYVRESSSAIKIYPLPQLNVGQFEISFEVQFFKKPTKPNWGYVVVSEKPLYNSSSSTDFELQLSEEGVLIGRILELAGITINKPELTQAAMVDNQVTLQKQNN